MYKSRLSPLLPSVSMAKEELFQLYLFSFFFSLSLCLRDPSQFEAEDLSWLVREDDDIQMVQSRRGSFNRCDFSSGKWIFDQSYPLYDSTCPYLSCAVTCRKNGRPDSDYEKWKWKPRGCSIPRFDALDFLGKMRRKRIMMVGDSIMRNQWESLVCLVEGVIPTGRKTVVYNGPSMAFHALDFQTSIEFSWAPLLVELRKGAEKKRVLHLDLIEENAKYWRGVDVLVFDSAHWWTQSHKWSPWDYFMVGRSTYKNMNSMVAYEKALITWAKWVNLNLNRSTTRVIFRSMSPRHNGENGLKCRDQKQPLPHLAREHVLEPLLVLKGVLRKMSFPIYLLDITTISTLRKDGHPSVFGHKMSHDEFNLSADCSHWCLPGVPDIWNEMLSALL